MDLSGFEVLRVFKGERVREPSEGENRREPSEERERERSKVVFVFS